MDAQCISFAVDESTDSTDKTQLCVFLRYFSKVKGEFCEDVLGLTQIHGHTRGKDIYEAIKMLNERGIDIQTAVSIATDGLPESLLQGKCSFCCFTLDGRVAMLRIPRIGCT